MLLFILPTALLFALFVIAYLRNPARMRVGFLFCLFLIGAGISYVAAALWLDSPVLNLSLVFIAFAAACVLVFGIYVLIALLLLNARQMRRREKHSVENHITLFLALTLAVVAGMGWVMRRFDVPLWARSLWGGLFAVLLFYFFHIFVFLTSALLVNAVRPRKNKDYIVVLGASLINGAVSPLLARRVDAAVHFYYKQAEKRPPPKLIMSGGKGGPNSPTEAEAMRTYALGKGVPPEDILLENRAENTYENMLYSKEIMDARSGETPGPRRSKPSYISIFATSNYHILRSGMLADRVGLRTRGIGAKTAWYYLPTALLREYVAFFWMRKTSLFVCAGVMFVVGIVLTFIPFDTIMANLRASI